MDNFGFLCGSYPVVKESLDGVVKHMGTKLLTHKVEMHEGGAELLGVCVYGQKLCTRLTNKRLWRTRKAALYALSRRAMPGWVWEILVGHLTFCSLVRRDALSCLHTIYPFIRKYYFSRATLWHSSG